MIADFFQLPPGEHLVEPAGVAVNSKGHIYVFHRGKHPLMEFDSSGKFVRSIADELFVTGTFPVSALLLSYYQAGYALHVPAALPVPGQANVPTWPGRRCRQ